MTVSWIETPLFVPRNLDELEMNSYWCFGAGGRGQVWMSITPAGWYFTDSSTYRGGNYGPVTGIEALCIMYELLDNLEDSLRYRKEPHNEALRSALRKAREGRESLAE